MVTSTTHDHIRRELRYVLDLNDRERLEFMEQPTLLKYPAADEIVNELERLLKRPKRPRMGNLLIVGESNNGKTTIVQKFHENRGTAFVNPNGKAVKPIIVVEAPPTADEKSLHFSILDRFHAPFRPTAPTSQLRLQAVHLLRECDTRMLIIDELHSLMGGAPRKQLEVMNTIKFLCNELQIPIVGVGTQVAVNVLRTDAQHTSRFRVMTKIESRRQGDDAAAVHGLQRQPREPAGRACRMRAHSDREGNRTDHARAHHQDGGALQSDGWHLGARAQNREWPVTVDLLPDETITSWLARCALAHGCAPTVLTSVLWPRWRLWTIDADRGIPAERRAVLCRATGIPTAAVHTASLEPIATRIAARRPKNDAAWPWILTLGRDRQHTSVSQYCPGCLEEDDPPHYRIGWRLAWRTSCARHGLTLADRCPSCGKAQQLHHLRADAQHVGGCAACGAELRHAKASPGHAGPASAVEFQQAADEVARTGRGRYFDADVEAGEWFAIADFFSSVIRRAVSNPTKGLTTALARAGVGWPLRLGATPGARIERLDVRTRQALLGGVQHVMRLGRDELHDALEAAGTSRQGLFGETRQVPTTLAALGPALPDHPKPHGHRLPRKRRGGPRPRHEVLKMMQRLENRLEHITT